MKTNKRMLFMIAVAVALLLSILLPTGASAVADTEGNLLKNGDFELALSGWTENSGTEGYIYSQSLKTDPQSDKFDPKYGQYKVETTTKFNASYSYYSQKVTLEEGKTYKLSCDIRLLTITASDSYVGAYVGFIQGSSTDITTFTEVTATSEVFRHFDQYFTPKSTQEFTICFGVGTPKKPVVADAYFDNLAIVEVDANSLTGSIVVTTIGTASGKVVNTQNQTADGNLYVILLGVLTALILLFGYFGVRRLMSMNDETIDNAVLKNDSFWKRLFTSPSFYLVVAVLVGFGIRFGMLYAIGGMSRDINAFSNWTSYMMKNGMKSFYTAYPTSATSTGVLYLLFIIGKIAELLNVSIGSAGFVMLLKIPSIFCDLIIIYVIYEYASRRLPKIAAFITAIMYAVLPVAFTLTAAWGEFFSIGLLLMLFAFTSFIDRKTVACIILAALAVVFDRFMLIPAAILAGCYIIYYINNASTSLALKTFVTLGVSLIAMYCISLPFTLVGIRGDEGTIMYPINRMFQDFTNGTGLFSYNSFSFYTLLGKNGLELPNKIFLLNALIMFVLIGWGIYLYWTNTNRVETLLYASFAMIFYSCFGLYNTQAALFTGLLLLIVYNLFAEDKRLSLLTLVYSVIAFVNAGQVLNACGYIGTGANAAFVYIKSNSAVMIVFSILHALATLYFVFVQYSIADSKKFKSITPIDMKLPVFAKLTLTNAKAKLKVRFAGKNKK